MALTMPRRPCPGSGFRSLDQPNATVFHLFGLDKRTRIRREIRVVSTVGHLYWAALRPRPNCVCFRRAAYNVALSRARYWSALGPGPSRSQSIAEKEPGGLFRSFRDYSATPRLVPVSFAAASAWPVGRLVRPPVSRPDLFLSGDAEHIAEYVADLNASHFQDVLYPVLLSARLLSGFFLLRVRSRNGTWLRSGRKLPVSAISTLPSRIFFTGDPRLRTERLGGSNPSASANLLVRRAPGNRFYSGSRSRRRVLEYQRNYS
jgi:hypothetical protein